MEPQNQNNANRRDNDQRIEVQNRMVNRGNNRILLRCFIPMLCVAIPVIAIAYDLIHPTELFNNSLMEKMDNRLTTLDKQVAHLKVNLDLYQTGKSIADERLDTLTQLVAQLGLENERLKQTCRDTHIMMNAEIESHHSFLGNQQKEANTDITNLQNIVKEITGKQEKHDLRLKQLQSKADDKQTELKDALKDLDTELREVVKRDIGSEYINWGRKNCDGFSQELYSGLAAGSHYQHEGGAAEYLCLPLNPEYNAQTTANTGAWIYGAEYESESHIFSQRMHDHNVPCARCYVPNRSVTMMIPAKRTCPPSWTKEYEGYLMSGHHAHKRAHNYICVNKDPQALDGLHMNDNGALLYFVQGSCKELGRCPPYVHGDKLACVICSK